MAGNPAVQHLYINVAPPLFLGLLPCCTDASPEAWSGLVGLNPGDPQQPTSFLVLADPKFQQTRPLLAGLDFAFPGATKVWPTFSTVRRWLRGAVPFGRPATCGEAAAQGTSNSSEPATLQPQPCAGGRSYQQRAALQAPRHVRMVG
jgi:hypothetical protein